MGSRERPWANSPLNLSVTGVILSGGRGTRMGGMDKGLLPFRGRSLVEWVLDVIEPQVAEVLISANQNLDRYLALGHPVLTDRVTGFAGPLAGLHAGLCLARSDLVIMVPCDSPFLPADLVQRMTRALLNSEADVAVARTGDQRHPVFCLCRASVLSNLTAFLEAGGRKVDAWYAALNVCEVAFDDHAGGLLNINTLEQLQALER
jgi:molybdopterin-guanine dinucleotide biosynthesis protein A